MNLFKNCKVVGKNVDPDVYHRGDPAIQRGNPAFPMTRSELMMFASNPARWIAGFVQKESDATKWGSLIDTLVLDPERFDKKVAVQPETYYNEKAGENKPWSGQATVCKEWKADHKDMLIISAETRQHSKTALAKLEADQIIWGFIKDSDKQVMVVGEYEDPDTKLTIPVKILIDLVPKLGTFFEKSLGDFKTARNAAPRAWSKAIFDRHYDVQAEMNLEVYRTATGEDRTDFRHIIQENIHPWQPARRYVSLDYLNCGHMKLVGALKTYCRCLKYYVWPSWDDEGDRIINGFSTCEPESWMIEASARDMWPSVEIAEEAEPQKDDVPD